MIRARLKRVQFALTVAVFLVPLASFAVAAYFRFATHAIPHHSSDVDPILYFGLLVVTTILWAIVAEHYGLTSMESHLTGAGHFHRILLACLMTKLAVLSITFFYRDATFSRVFVWISALSMLLFTILLHYTFRWIWSRSRNKAFIHFLIVGADEFAVHVAETLLSGPVAPCSITAHIRLPHQVCAVKDRPVHEISDVKELAIGNGFDEVIIAIPPTSLGALPCLRAQLSPLCAPTRLVLDLGEGVGGHGRLLNLGSFALLDLQTTHAESNLYIILKRAFDLIFSISVVLLFAPVFALIALAVWFSSPGPVIFVQTRVGLNGKLFRMYKFRTMRVASPDESDRRWTVKEDPRCTKLGKLLRQTGLDELPQFFNVLKGNMSVVGPRPERPLLVQRFMQSVGNYNSRHYLKVGITGWAQVNGWRGDTSIEKRIEYDLYYVRHWTPAFDLLIVLLTFFRGFTSKNAY
jgi:Undecaprenyl-phosphate glucose phosphotransferase